MTALMFAASNVSLAQMDLHFLPHFHHHFYYDFGYLTPYISFFYFLHAQGRRDLIQMLLESNANPIQFNKKGYGAHSIAYFNEHFAESKWISDVGLIRAIQEANLPVMLLLLQDGANPNLQTSTGATALIVATHAGDTEAVRQILGIQGINPDFQEHDGWTALMFAAYNNNVDIVHLLLQHGVSMAVENTQGHTAFSIARDLGRWEALQVLEQRYAMVRAHHYASTASSSAAPTSTTTSGGGGDGSGDGSDDASHDATSSDASNGAGSIVQDAPERKGTAGGNAWKLW
jgi:ankyrin repeat protein